MSAARRQQEKPSFEVSLRRLEEIVEQLEKGAVPLEDSLKMYEEGMNLSRACLEQLNDVELRLKKLTRDAGGKFMLVDDDDDAAGDSAPGRRERP